MVVQMLTQAKSKPDVARYLAYIYGNGKKVQSLGVTDAQLILLRSSAAINLKNMIKSAFKHLNEDDRAYIRSCALNCLDDPNGQIRTLTGTLITEIVHKGGVQGWPELLPELLSLAANEKGNVSNAAQEASMSALVKVCEDRKDDLEKTYQEQKPLHFILPRLLDICSSSNAQVRSLAIACINVFIPQSSEVLVSFLDAILEQLFRLANDGSADVRRNLCRAFVLISDVTPDRILPHMEGLVRYMCLQQKRKEETEAALEAAEFWLAISENEQVCGSLEPYLDTIIPVLLESMVYDEESIIRLAGSAEDAAIEDRSEDIKPHFAGARTKGSVPNGQAFHDDALEDGEVEEEDEEYDDDDVEDQWNLRKCSAAALDVLASRFQKLVFDIAFSYLNRNLTNQEWPFRESAVLAMGAIAEGCMDAVAPDLPNIVPYFTSLLADQEPSVRLITCWALGRYSTWALGLQDRHDKHRYFEPILKGVLERMLDKVKKVQTAAASAVASMSEKAGNDLTPYCKPMIETFVGCFDFYKARNLYVLYDCVQTLADQVGSALREPDLVNLLMPAIIRRWEKVPDQSQELFPLHECLSYITAALGEAFAPFAAPIFNRCISIVRQNLEQLHLAESDGHIDKPDKDFLVTSLDLLSSMIQALNPTESGQLVQNSQPRFFDLLLYCMRDVHSDVRQSAYALLGDCAVNIFNQLHPYLPPLMPEIIEQLDVGYARSSNQSAAFSVINNACWSCGEIAMKYKQEMSPYVPQLYRKLHLLINQTGLPSSVLENAIIAIGRLGIHSSDIVSPHLGEFVGRFLTIIAPVEQTDEKAHAFLGLNRMIIKNPYAMGPFLLPYFQASLAYTKASATPQDQGQTIGHLFQQVCISPLGLRMKTCH